MGKLTSNILDLDGLAGLLKVKTVMEYDDFFVENCYCECSEELQNESKCECGFEDQRGQLYDKYVSAVESIAEKLLNEHGLTLIKNEKKFNYRIMPQQNWLDAAGKVMTTIEGYGMFGYNGRVKEFLRSGPYTAREAVLQHTHWLKEWYAVYCDGNAQDRLSRALR